MIANSILYKELFILILLFSPIITFGVTNLKVGEPAPTFILKDLNGNNVYLRDFCGELRKKEATSHVVIISFFATWCAPCRHEIPVLQKFYSDFKKEGIKIFLVAVGEKRKKVLSFVSAKEITLPVLLDIYATTAKNYGVADHLGRATLPQIFIIDRKGKIAYIKKGFSKDNNLRKILIEKVSKLLN